MSNVFAKSLQDLTRSILGWGIGLGLLSAVLFSFFPSTGDSPEFEAYWESLPASMKAAFPSAAPITTPGGYLQVEVMAYLPLLLSIFAIGHSAAAIVGEEEQRTLDFLVAQPVSRRQVALAKLGAIALAILAIATIVGVFLLLAAWLTGIRVNALPLLIAAWNVIPPVLVVAALTFVGSASFRRKRDATVLGTAFLVVSYAINAVGHLVPALDPWRLLSIFRYYEASQPVGGTLDPISMAILVLLAVILGLGGVAAFERKDLMI